MREYPGKVNTWLDGFAENMVTEIKLSFGTSPSPPGGPPGVDTGALRASITWENTGPFERTISDGVEYGVELEDGTERNGGPRPFMRPVFDRANQRIEGDARAKLNLE
jgi:hypothetical protein